MRPTTGRSGHATRVTRRVMSYSSVDSVFWLSLGSVSSRSPHTATRPKYTGWPNGFTFCGSTP